MRIKLFEEYNKYEYDSFKVKITKDYFKKYTDLQERLSILAFEIFEIENGEEFDDDGRVDWTETHVDFLLSESEDHIYVCLLDGNNNETNVKVPKHLILHPEDLELYYNSKKFDL